MMNNVVIPQDHIDYLVSNQNEGTYEAFDEKYGEGRAQQILAQRKQKEEAGWVQKTLDDVSVGLTEALPMAAKGALQGAVNAPAALIRDNIWDPGELKFWDKDRGVVFEWIDPVEREGTQNALRTLAEGEAQSVTGSVVKGVSQFTAGWLSLGKFFKIGKGFLGAATSGAATDFLAFEGDEGNVVDFLSELGISNEFLNDYLGSDDEDPDWENRLKNAVVGLGIGAGAEGVLRIFRGAKKLRKGDASGKQEIQDGLDYIEETAKKEDARTVVDDGVEPPADTPEELLEQVQRKSPSRPMLSPDEADLVAEAAVVRAHQPVAQRPEVPLNLKHVQTVDDMDDLLISQREVLGDRFDKIRGGNKEGVQKWSEVKRRSTIMGRELARMSGEDPDAFLKRSHAAFGGNARDMAADYHAKYAVLMSMQEEVIRLGRKRNQGLASAVEDEELVRLAGLASELMASVKGIESNVARTLRSMALARKSDEGMRKMLTDLNGQSVRSTADQIASAVKEVDDLPSSVRRTGENSHLAQTVKRVSKSKSILDDVNTFRINAMLSGPGTQEVNFVSNFMNLLLIPTEQALGGRPIHAMRTVAGMVSSADESIKAALKAFWHEEAFLDPFSQKLEIDGRGKLAQSKNPAAKLVRMPSRFMVSADELFKQAAYRGRIKADAVFEANARGLSGSERIAFIKNYIQNSFDDSGAALRGDALLQAQRTTFTEHAPERVVQDIMRWADAFPIIRLFVPFIRTPVNILSQSFQHLPALGAFSKRFQADLKAGGVRRSQAIGRQVLGTALTVSAIALAAQGNITGSGPRNHALRKVWLKNNRPYSFRWTDKDGNVNYWEFKRMEPLSTVLGIAADFVEISGMDDELVEEDRLNLGLALAASLAENSINKTFTQGISDAIDLMQDPEMTAERFAGKMAASFVPNAITQIQNDEMLRETRNIADHLMAKVGMDGVDPRRDILGEIVYRPGNKWDPLGLTKQDSRKPDPVMAEIERLGRRFGSSFDIPRVYKIAGNDIREIMVEGNENQSLYDRRLELSSEIKIGGRTLRQALKRLITSPRYQRMRDGDSVDNKGPRHQAISRLIRKYRGKADKQLLRDSEKYRELKTGLRKQKRAARKPLTTEELFEIK